MIVISRSLRTQTCDSLGRLDTFNHEQPDIGLYSDPQMRIPDDLKDGEEFSLRVNVVNIGQGSASETTLDVYGGPGHLSPNNIADRYLLGQFRLDRIGPMQARKVDVPLTYWFGLEKIYFRARTPESDYDPANNMHTITLKADSPLDEYGYGQGGAVTGILRVAVYRQPGELSEEVDLKLYRAGRDRPTFESTKNPTVWTLDPGEYDVYAKVAEVAEVEQWIRGIRIPQAWGRDDGRVLERPNLSLDIVLEKLENALAELDYEETDVGLKLRLPGDVLYESGKAEINPYAMDVMRQVGVVLRTYPNADILIEGHTDNIGTVEDNQQLSRDRADSVKSWLAEDQGVLAERMTTVGWGARQPVVSHDTEQDRQRNRRVTITILRSEEGE